MRTPYRFLRCRLLYPALVAAALAMPGAAALADPLYNVTILGAAGGAATGINSAGDVVGTVTGASTYGFVYASGTFTQLGTLGGANSGANGINDLGQIVGAADTAGGQSHAFLYASGRFTDLGTFGGASSVANAINNQGVVVGNATTRDSIYFPQAFRYADGNLQALGTLPGGLGSYAYAINNHGLIGGASYEGEFDSPGYPSYAVTYGNGGVQQLGGVSHQDQSAIYGVNDAGLAVGAISGGNFPHGSHSFLYQGGTIIDLGVFEAFLDSNWANDINNLGQIVGGGIVDLADEQYGVHGYLYQNGRFVDLNTLIDPALGLEITSAAGINDASQIAATACSGGQLTGVCYAVRLDLVPAVPEPGSWAMLALGLGLAGARKGMTRRA